MGIKEHEVEKSYYQLLEFKQEVADFLLYVTGSHSHKEYEEHWIESAREKVNRLRDKEGEACMLVGLLHQYDKPEYVFSDGKVYRQSFLYGQYLEASRNTHNWLNVANFYLRGDWACLGETSEDVSTSI